MSRGSSSARYSSRSASAEGKLVATLAAAKGPLRVPDWHVDSWAHYLPVVCSPERLTLRAGLLFQQYDVGNAPDLNVLESHAPLQTDARIQRHALQRLADPEERAHRSGRARSRRPRSHGPRQASRSTARAAPMPASMRSPRSRTSTSPRRCRPSALLAAAQRRAARRHQRAARRDRRHTASTPATAPRRAATSIRSRAGARRSPSRSSGGCASRSTSRACGAAADASSRASHDFASFTDDDPDEKSTTVQVTRLDVDEDGALIAHSHRRLAFSLEDGPAHRGRPGRGRARRAVARGGRCAPGVAVRRCPRRLTAPASGLFLESVAMAAGPGQGSRSASRFD